MNIVNQLTWRHMMKNKRRTLVTIIGVTISVAMITAVATLASSFINFGIKEHIAHEGEWHVEYKDIDSEQLNSIKSDKNSDSVILSRDLGYADLPNSENPAKPYVFIKQYNNIGFEQMPIEIISGRLPENNHEIVISGHMLTNGKVDFSIGDQLTLDIGQRVTTDEDYKDYDLGQTFRLYGDEEVLETIEPIEKHDYTIVGIMERPTWEPYQAPGYTVLSYMFEDNISEEAHADALVIWHKVNKNNLEHAEQLGKSLGIGEVTPNESLLRYYGISRYDFLVGVIYSVVAIVMTVIIIGSISLIYNAFAISVSERSRHLGMLSSVGATKKQKRNSILFEGAVIGIFSIPLGLVSGVGGIAVTLYFVNRVVQEFSLFKTNLTVHVTPLSIIVAIIIAILTLFISAFIPARRAARISAIDAIRQSEDIKLTRKKVKTSKIVRKIFGIEAEIALKNLKRNKRRYYATIFSLVISIVLFLTVSFFSEQIRTTSHVSMSSTNYDIDITHVFQDGEFDEHLKQSIKSLEDVTDFTELTYAYVETELTEDQINESIEADVVDGQAVVYMSLYALDESTLRTYAKEVGVDYNQLNDPTKLSGILINAMASQGDKIGETASVDMNPGDQLNLSYYDWEKDKDVEISYVELAALTDKRPHGVDLPLNAHNINMIISEEVLNELNETYQMENFTQLVLSSTDPLTTDEQLQTMVDAQMNIYNVHKTGQEEKSILLIISIFTYGFITLMTLIAIANIFNTISTSVSLRTREFGMLKSVGMTPKGFNRMIHYESLFYGMKALLFGLPISFGIMLLIYREMAGAFDYPLHLPWGSIIGVIIGVFLIVGIAMVYSSSQVKKVNIIDALKTENI